MSAFSSSNTPKLVQSAHARDATILVEKISRLKIFDCAYWKQYCFGLTSVTLLDRAIELKFYGGMYGGSGRPSPFICLLLKMLQLRPDMDIVLEFILQEDYKYIRVLGMFYLRLTGKAEHIYRTLEPLYADRRKLAFRGTGGWEVRHVDEFVDDLLNEELCCDIAMPYLLPRHILQERGDLVPRESALPAELRTAEALDAAALQLEAQEIAAARASEEVAQDVEKEGSVEHWQKLRQKLGIKNPLV